MTEEASVVDRVEASARGQIESAMDETLLCTTLASGLVGSGVAMKTDIAYAWLAGDVPTRQYASEYVERRPLVFASATVPDMPPPQSSSVDSSATGTNKRVKYYDVVQHVTTGEASTSSNVKADGSTTVVMTDVGVESVAQLRDSCHRSVPLATDLMTEHIFGAHPPKRSLIDTLCRLLLVLLFEPIRLEIDVHFLRPVGTDVNAQIQYATANIANATQDERLESDRVVQSHLASFAVNWFQGVTVLAVDYRHLSVPVLRVCSELLNNYTRYFRPAGVEISAQHIRLSEFKYNARVTRLLDRGALIGALCCSIVASCPNSQALLVKDAFILALDESGAVASEIVATPAGRRFASREEITRNVRSARQMTLAHEIPPVVDEEQTQTPAELYADVVDKIRRKYCVADI